MPQSSGPKTGVTIPIEPTIHVMNDSRQMLRWMQSVYKTLVGGTMLAQPVGTNAQGIYNKFVLANGNGVMIRIGAAGSGETYTWNSINSTVVINHGLQRQPIGFHVVDADGLIVVYRTAGQPLNKDNIYLSANVPNVNTTIYIF